MKGKKEKQHVLLPQPHPPHLDQILRNLRHPLFTLMHNKVRPVYQLFINLLGSNPIQIRPSQVRPSQANPRIQARTIKHPPFNPEPKPEPKTKKPRTKKSS